MNQALMLYPMLTLIGWTMLMLTLVGQRRFASRLHPREFAVGESAQVPPRVSLPNRNFMNLLEMPVLFYVVCISLYVTKNVDSVSIWLAWLYVLLRILHSLIHLSYNHVVHRLLAFTFSNFTLIALWAIFIVRLSA